MPHPSRGFCERVGVLISAAPPLRFRTLRSPVILSPAFFAGRRISISSAPAHACAESFMLMRASFGFHSLGHLVSGYPQRLQGLGYRIINFRRRCSPVGGLNPLDRFPGIDVPFAPGDQSLRHNPTDVIAHHPSFSLLRPGKLLCTQYAAFCTCRCSAH